MACKTSMYLRRLQRILIGFKAPLCSIHFAVVQMKYSTILLLICTRRFLSLSYKKIVAVPEATLTLDIGSPSMSSCQPEAIDRLAERFPNLHIVVCHLLAPTRDDGHHLACALPYLAHDNVWIDLSALPWNTAPDPYPFPTALSYIRLAKEILGTRKIMWGTDAPCVLTKFSYKELYTYLMESDVFNEHELEDVFYNNAVEAYYL